MGASPLGYRLKSEPIGWSGFVLAATLLVQVCSAARASAADSCEFQTIGVDTTGARLHAGAFDGRAVSQVFVAPESLISSITVWRPATEQVNITGMHLFITDVTPGTATPDPLNVILDGPTLVLPYVGATAKPVTYGFDPPFQLPHTGAFAFAIKQESPDCTGILVLLADSTSAYPDGDAWTIYPFVTCDGLGRSPAFHTNADLVFEIQFCIGVVATQRTTWGGMKAHYR